MGGLHQGKKHREFMQELLASASLSLLPAGGGLRQSPSVGPGPANEKPRRSGCSAGACGKRMGVGGLQLPATSTGLLGVAVVLGGGRGGK